MDIADIGIKVLSAADMGMRGMGRTDLRDAVRGGRLVVVHRGWYVDATTWRGWYPESRHVAKALAVVRTMRGGEVLLSHASAAALWGLPFYRFDPPRVHVSGAGTNGVTRGSSGVARHEVAVEGHHAEVDGVPVTSLARTAADLAGRLPLEAAISIVDAALRKVAWVDGSRRYDIDAAEEWKAKVLGCSALRRGARGSVQGRWVVEFADGRAQLPGESVSRLYLHQLGFAPPRLQVRIDHSTGWYDIDFGLDDVQVWGEFDGTGKYTDPEMLAERSTAEAVLEEKRREDDIRGRTRRPIIRWGSPHIRDVDAFRQRLADFHVRPPAGPGGVSRSFS
ncbi:hypothetical protein [Microbacterium pumilum]|uniref:Transcriptional regulator, AbiEi antitoxin, Type IV TA system n=1 Tax=Microbacterium pumilum TaxID=344165 RepID=A0ABP5DM33_9MICO